MRNLSKLFTLLIVCTLSAINLVNAQTAPLIIRGKVIDKSDKSAVQGVSVSEIDKDGRIIKGASTDAEGNYAIKITNPKNRLSFSSIGYSNNIQGINGRTSINISLESSNKDMDEVVVVAQRKTDDGNVAQNERNITGAVAKVSAKEMEEMQATSIDQALQGRLAGVDIAASAGDPGSGMSIRIRGTSSINSSSDPLIVVDGMPYETQIPADFNFGTADEVGYAQLLNIAPSDIKEITALKDAAATAVWGSRAANGVLIITTKRGSIGKPKISYTFKGSMTKQPNSIPLLSGDQYSMLIPEEVMNRTGTPLNTQNVKEFQYDPNDFYWYKNYANNTNWVDAITRVGHIQDHNVSITGGGEKAKYFTSLGFQENKGTTIGTDLNRLNARINLDYTVSSRIRFRSDLAYTHSVYNRNYTNSSSGSDQVRNIAYLKMPNMSIFEYDEYGNPTPNFFSPAQNIQGTYPRTYNPVAMAKFGKNNFISERVIPHFKLEYDIRESVLMATFDVQFDINNTKNKSFLPQVATGRPWTETVVNRAYDGDLDNFNVQTKTNLVYTPKFKTDKHSLISYLSLNTYDNKGVSYEALTSNAASSLLQDPSIPARTANNDLRLTAGFYQQRSIGAAFNTTYGFMKDRYVFNVAVRGDGNSRFGPNNRYGIFPSISFRYRISDEKFLRNVKAINDLSFRASYGRTGKEPRRDYSFYNIYGNFDWSYLGMPGVYSSNMELKNLKWETLVGHNAGINLIAFKRRLSLDIDLYKNRTVNMYYPGLQISSFTGFDKVDMNVGTMDNQGWEVALRTTPIKNNNWQLDFNVNVSYNVNMIREISEYYPRERGNIEANGQYRVFMQEDNPFGSFYGFKFKGVYKDKSATVAKDGSGKPIVGPNGQVVYMRFNYPKVDYVFQPGDAIYEDINHDGNIDQNDVVYLGNSNPKFSGGFGPSLKFKKALTLSAFLNYRWGYQIINGTKMTTTNMYGYDNQSTAVLRRWRHEGDETDMPRAIWNAGYNWLGSDRYVEDASFIRLRFVTVRYDFQPKMLKKMKFKSLSAYLTAENIFTWTKYTGQDPEVTSRGSDPFRVAADYSMTPPAKTLTLGISTTF